MRTEHRSKGVYRGLLSMEDGNCLITRGSGWSSGFRGVGPAGGFQWGWEQKWKRLSIFGISV